MKTGAKPAQNVEAQVTKVSRDPVRGIGIEFPIALLDPGVESPRVSFSPEAEAAVNTIGPGETLDLETIVMIDRDGNQVLHFSRVL